MRSGNNKRGVTAVFLTIMTGTMISVVIAFVVLSSRLAAVGMAESVFNLAGRSVLSEFDRELKERYGFIAFIGEGAAAGEKILRYADRSFGDDEDIIIGGIEVDMKDHCLYDRKTFEEELEEIVTCGAFSALDKEKEKVPLRTGERVLRNRQITASLPSAAYSGERNSTAPVISLLKNIGSIEGLFRSGTREYAKMVYIFDRFRSGTSPDGKYETFFVNEVEYIIGGRMSDKDNLKEVKKDFKEIRTALNMMYLPTDAEKMQGLTVLSQLLTPGPEAAATKAGLMLFWSKLEAENDWKLISAGSTVPVFKTKASWATDISILETGGDEMFSPEDESGYRYDDYLKILLCTVPDEVETARIMDLIEINLKGTYNGAFDMKSCHTGLSFKVKVNGKELTFEETY